MNGIKLIRFTNIICMGKWLLISHLAFAEALSKYASITYVHTEVQFAQIILAHTCEGKKRNVFMSEIPFSPTCTRENIRAKWDFCKSSQLFTTPSAKAKAQRIGRNRSAE